MLNVFLPLWIYILYFLLPKTYLIIYGSSCHPLMEERCICFQKLTASMTLIIHIFGKLLNNNNNNHYVYHYVSGIELCTLST